jgi:hypothetical protein
MGTMTSGRNRQVKLAERLGIENPEQLSFSELRAKINACPATQEQMQFIATLLKYWDMQPPATELKFAQAARILNEVAPLVNDRVLTEQGWTAGKVLKWNDGYFRICRIHNHKMFTLARVELARPSPRELLVISETTDGRKLRHPFTLFEQDAEAIDPETHQP